MEADTWTVVRDELSMRDGVRAGRIFRSHGLRYGDHFVCFLSGAGLVLKLPAERVAQLVADGIGQPFTSGARVRDEWVTVPPASASSWLQLADEALRFAESS